MTRMRAAGPRLAFASRMRGFGLLLALVLVPSVARAAEGAHDEPPRQAVYPLTLVASMELLPGGVDGRWGVSFERHPTRAGVGYGVAGGVGAFAEGQDGAQKRSSMGVWLMPMVRPGFYFGTRREIDVSGCLCLGLGPRIEGPAYDAARLSLVAQPGFLFAVARFAFGLSMNLSETVWTSRPESPPGFGVGASVQLGVAL